MSKLFSTTLADGSELVRMVRPFSWDDYRWCAEPGCDKPCTSIYGMDDRGRAGGVGWIGWRAACGRKHALSIWARELTEPAS